MVEEKKVPLTQDAFDRLKSQLEILEGVERPHVIEEIARARAHGDLSENAEYHAAREKQGQLEAKIREMRLKLESAEIIKADNEAIVKPGKLVTIKFVGDDEPEIYFVGEREEKTGDHDVLTPESPLGQALVGCAAGDTVAVKVNDRDLKVEVLEVRAP